jgi:hypothetical protein
MGLKTSNYERKTIVAGKRRENYFTLISYKINTISKLNDAIV